MEKLKAFGDVKENKTVTKKPFGIDLGTTNSCITIGVGNHAEIIELMDEKRTIPSCVMWIGGDNFIVGKEAYLNRHKSNVIYSVKKYMQTPNKIITLTLDDGTEKQMTPAEVSAEILKGLVKETDGIYGEVKDVVITVPAYFNQIGVNNTKKAAELAGLNCINILREPTSAALAYKLDKNTNMEKVLVYDLGGGTFDVSLLQITHQIDSELYELYGIEQPDEKANTIVKALAIDGDGHLGGDDYDKELYKVLLKKLSDLGHNNIEQFIKKEDKERLILKLEGMKKIGVIYSQECTVNISLTNGVKIHEVLHFSYNDFYEAFLPIYIKTKKCVDSVLSRGNCNVKTIVLIGGSTKNPILCDLLNNDYPGIIINNSLNPDESVAIGAGIKAKSTLFGQNSVKVFDILPLAIGIFTKDEIFKIIDRDTELPVTKEYLFETSHDNQEFVNVRLFQGNSVIPENCLEIGTIRIDNIRKAPKGEVKVGISLTINADSILKCKTVVDDIYKEIELDLNSIESKKELTKEEKFLLRCKRAAESMDKETRKTLLEMIENNIDIKIIKDFMKENTKRVGNRNGGK